jgi:hypothetical protein
MMGIVPWGPLLMAHAMAIWVDDRPRSLATAVHGAEAELRDLEARSPESAVLHRFAPNDRGYMPALTASIFTASNSFTRSLNRS